MCRERRRWRLRSAIFSDCDRFFFPAVCVGEIVCVLLAPGCLLIVVVAVNVDVAVVVVFWHHLLFVIRFIIIVHRSVAYVCNCMC